MGQMMESHSHDGGRAFHEHPWPKTGPLAHGHVGDFMVEYDEEAPPNSLYLMIAPVVRVESGFWDDLNKPIWGSTDGSV